jgi:hypothetical protein
VDTLPQASVALMVNVRVTAQPLIESVCETFVLTKVQLSVALTSAFTLASVGKLEGLQPKTLFAGTLEIVGAVVSTVQV